MKKILFIVPSLKMGGGVERIASSLAKELRDKYSISILTFYAFSNSYNIANINIDTMNEDIRNGIFSKIYKIFNRARKIKSKTKERNADMIISFMEEANFSAIIAKVLLKNKATLIISSHCNPYLHSSFYRVLMRFLYKKADKIITVSSGVKKIFVKKLKMADEKIKTIHNFVDIELIKEASNASLDEQHREFFLNNNSFKFISLGRLSKEKNYISTINAFSLIKNKHPKAKLFIIGEGPQKKELENIISNLNMQNDIFLLGFQSNPFKFLRHADCFVFNSISEGFGLAIAEALALQLPIISSDCNFGPREILCNNSEETNGDANSIKKCPYGILIPINNSGLLCEAMRKLIENEKMRKDLIEKAPTGAIRFSKNHIISEWISIIQDQ